SVHHLMEHFPQSGLSKWASLQAVEKTVKAFVRENDTNAKFGHDLAELFSVANKWGLPKPPQELITIVQCSLGVRYNEPPVSVEEAVRAHLVSLELTGVAARHIGELLGRSLPEVPKLMVEGVIAGRRYQLPLGEFIQKQVQAYNHNEACWPKGK
ncbi:MAG: HEPN domain-containing protein, partial [Armatimonadota bacterium]|nr:HEPN domain-containing protein [Armatimonadota bacterium]